MLEDRDYMRRSPYGDDEEKRMRSGRNCLLLLIAINALVFLLFRGSRGLCVNPEDVREGHVLQIVTAVFMHEDFFHILFNMYTLYFFGMITAPVIGARRFLSLFLFSGVTGNVLWLAANWYSPHALLGASGAVMGVIMATAMLAPDIKILILFVPFPLKLRTAALVFAGLDVFMFAFGAQSNVAYLAHIGGFLAGYLFSVIFLRREIQWDPLLSLFRRKSGPEMPRGWRMGSGNAENDTPNPKNQPGQGLVTQKELDYLLDKLSRNGINSLSDAELARLRQAREQMRSGR